MKRLYLIILLLATCMMSANAQSGLEINDLFDGEYSNDPRATEIEMSGGVLKDYSLTVYRSLTLVDAPEAARQIETLLREDGANALQREVTYRNGGIYYAFYQLPKQNNIYRYIFYIDLNKTGGNKIMLVYLAGKADSKQIKKMLNLNDNKK